MIFQCPACRQRYNVAAARIPDGGVMRCQACKTSFSPIPREGTRLLLGHESSFLGPLVMDLTSAGGMTPYWAKTGAEVAAVVPKVRPAVVLLDVALPDAYGFEVCARVREIEGFAEVRIVYLASVFDKTRYKRKPVGLYGADDYIEKHHIKDDLVPKIRALLSRGGAPAALPPAPPDAEPRPVARVQPVPPSPASAAAGANQFRTDELEPTERAAKDDLLTKAHRFARIIVSDIGLYNQEAIDRGLADGKIGEYLAKDMEEGTKLFFSRFPAESIGGQNPLQAAMDDYLARRRAQARGQ